MTVRLVDPRTDSTADGFMPAPRPASLSGARVALLANGKTHGEFILETLGGLLRERHGIGEARLWTKPHPSGPPTADQLREISEYADLVVTAIGDCGSCSSCSVFDGIGFERRGIPAAVIITEPFRATAAAIAGLNGATGFRVATLTHPVTSKEIDALVTETGAVVELVADIWLHGPVDDVAPAGPSGLDESVVRAVVEEFREALNSDGSDLVLEEVVDGRIVARLDTVGHGCEECLLSATTIEAMLRSAVSGQTGTAPQIVLTDNRGAVVVS
jgi:Fe-S cluster biogenesis protein NfuA